VFGLVVVLRTGSQTGPPLATAQTWGRRAVSPGYAGADPPELHHSRGRGRSRAARPRDSGETCAPNRSWLPHARATRQTS